MITIPSDGSYTIEFQSDNKSKFSWYDPIGNILYNEDVAYTSGLGTQTYSLSNLTAGDHRLTFEVINLYRGDPYSWDVNPGGYYIKIGRTVHCMFAISSNGSTSPTGELKLTGLPFTATIPNANGTRGGGGVLFPGYHMASGVTKCVANGTTLFLLLSDSSRLQTDSSGIGYGYNAAQLSGMFSYITAS